MTKEEFEQSYAERSMVTVKWLRMYGLEAQLCDCGEDGCRGWRMKSQSDDPNVTQGRAE